MALKEDQKKYELLLIFSPEIPASAFEKELSEFKSFLKEHAGGIFFEDMWGLKRLAYRVRKFSEGYYAILYFYAEPEQIHEVKQTARLNTRVIRHMLLTLPDSFEPKKITEEDLTAAAAPRVMKKTMRPKKTFEVTAPPKPFIETPVETAGEPKSAMLKGKTEEEKLKAVEKTLESILENPDINI